MKKFFAIITIASVVMVSCNDAATEAKTGTDTVKPVENVTPAVNDTTAKPAMDTTAKPAVADTTKK
jgi:hypothetical protein